MLCAELTNFLSWETSEKLLSLKAVFTAIIVSAAVRPKKKNPTNSPSVDPELLVDSKKLDSH